MGKTNVLVVDDGIGQEDEINSIISFLEKNKFCIKCKSIEETKFLDFNSLSFIILDWEFSPFIEEENISSGVTIGSQFKKVAEDKVLNFIKEIRETRFVPLLIVTNNLPEAKNAIESAGFLDENSLVDITSKESIATEESLECEISKVFGNKPALNFYKQWAESVDGALLSLFNDLKQYGHGWIKVLYNCFLEDQGTLTNPQIATYEVENFLNDWLKNSTMVFDFDFESIPNGDNIEKLIMRNIIERTMTIPATEKSMCGDIYKIDEKNYVINISPQCDLERDSDPKVILLKGNELKDNKIKPCLEEHPVIWHNGAFIDSATNCTIAFIDNKIIKFDLKDFEYAKLSESKSIENVEGKLKRLLPPHITKLQHRFSQYITRDSLMRLPDKAVGYKKFNCKSTICGGDGCIVKKINEEPQ